LPMAGLRDARNIETVEVYEVVVNI
jgi:hypothetical protein